MLPLLLILKHRVASYIQYKLGIEHAGAIDLNAACAGFTYGLQLANSLISSGMHHKILVIGAETLSKITDYTDRSTCILFGDGAGAFLVESNKDQSSFIGQTNGSNGGKGKISMLRTLLINSTMKH